jgi:type VI secretion system protein ImpL
MESVERTSLSSPWLWTLLGIAGIVLLIILLIGLRRFFYKPTSDEEKDSGIWGHIRKKVRIGLARYGYFPQDPLSQSFNKALKTLKETINDPDYRYTLPWFFVMGCSDDERYNFLESINLSLPVGTPKNLDQISPCVWWFFDHGVLLDIRQSLFLDPNDATSNPEAWRLLLALLNSHRPDRPLDGLVLTISATELLTTDRNTLIERASVIHSKLWHAEKILRITLPIYVVITGCETIKGFAEFADSIPPRNRENIFGWSNPFSLETRYEKCWIDKIFENIVNQVIKVQQNIFSHEPGQSINSSISLLPREFIHLKKPLGDFLEILLYNTEYRDPFFFRGVFFSGNNQTNHLLPSQSNDEGVENSDGSEPFKSSTCPIPDHDQSSDKGFFKKLCFVTDLFRKKIFPEGGIAKPFPSGFFARDRLLRLAQITVAVVVIVGTFGLIRSYQRLDSIRRDIQQNIDRVGYVLQRTKSQKTQKLNDVFFEEQTQELLKVILNLHHKKLSSFFIPYSWFNLIDSKVRKVLILAQNKIIFRGMHEKLRSLLKNAVSGDLPSIKMTEDHPNILNPVHTVAFQELSTYISTLNRLQKLAELYNNLSETGNLKDFGTLTRELFRFELPQTFYKHEQNFYKKIFLQANNIQLVPLYHYRKAAMRRFQKLTHEFLTKAMNPNHLAPVLTDLESNLTAFASGSNSYKLADLRLLAQQITESVNIFNSPLSRWITKEHFLPGIEYTNLLENIAFCSFLPPQTSSRFGQDCQKKFNEFRGLIRSYTSAATGALFNPDASSQVRVSESLLNFLGFLNLLISKSFMRDISPAAPFKVSIASHNSLLWNYGILRQISLIIDDYKKFTGNKTGNLPPAVRKTVMRLCQAGLENTIKTKLYESQDVRLKEQAIGTGAAPEDPLLPQVQNLRAVTPLLGSLLLEFRNLGMMDIYTHLRQALYNESTSLLSQINDISEADGPYDPNPQVVAMWRGDPQQVYAAFDVTDAQSMKLYLTRNRERLRYLAREFAEPPVNLMKELFSQDASSMPHILLKWADILNQLELYARKAPNTLITLEEFLTTTLPEMTVQGCPLVLQFNQVPQGVDYFLDKLNHIRQLFLRRCTRSNDIASIASYEALQTYFNKHLAKRYPFVPPGFENKYPDAKFHHVKEFFKVFDQEAPFSKVTLMKSAILNPEHKKAIQFIDDIEAIRPFFRTLISPPNPSNNTRASSTVPLKVIFRFDRKDMVNADQLISWTISLGDAIVTSRDVTSNITWGCGTPITMKMRWALGSLFAPTNSTHQPHLKVSGPEATFKFTGVWSLLKLIQTQMAKPSDAPLPKSARKTLLRFEVPTVFKSKQYAESGKETSNSGPQAPKLYTRVFMSINMNGGPTIAELQVPKKFPVLAPRLTGPDLP